MKKIYFFLLAVLLVCQSGLSPLKAASVTVPTVGVEYTIVHQTGLYIGRTVADNPKIVAPSGAYNQVFQFIPVPEEDGNYYIQNMDADEYLVRWNQPKTDGTGQDTWTMVWKTSLEEATTANDAKYQIIADGDYVYIKNLGTGAGNLGVDNNDPNSSVFGNKGTGDKSRWTIKEYSSEADKTPLITKLIEANFIYDNTEAGNGPDQYPAVKRTTLKDKIDAGQALVDDPSAWQTEINVALEDLIAALDDYAKSVYPLRPSLTTRWRIQHSSGLVFSNSVKIVEPTYTPEQEYTFVPTADPDVFSIQAVATSSYLTRSENGWDLIWGEDPSDVLTQFTIKKVASSPGYYTIHVLGLSGNKTADFSFVGTDSNDANSTVFADKDGKDGKHYWKFVDAINGPVIKTALEEAIAKVNDFLSFAVKGDGSDQYPATEYDALTTTLATASSVLNNESASQLLVGTTTLELNEALANAVAAVNPFIPSTAITYHIIHYSGLYLGEYTDVEQDRFNYVSVSTPTKMSDQIFSLTPVTGKAGIVNIKIASLLDAGYLTRLNNPTGEDGKYDDYGLTWGPEPADEFAQFEIKRSGVKATKDYYTIRCIKEGSQRTASYLGTDNSVASRDGAWIDKDGKSTAHLWKVLDSTLNPDAIKGVAVGSKLNIYSSGNQLNIKDLEGNNRISIYTTTGQLISRTDLSGSAFAKGLQTGNYIVVVDGQSSYRGIVIVR
ncbi:hypothetical protein FACS189413_07950 [Bacteroidia bacterium]|nr:hypothetical protein FACS189413_07950 [Bacteroidia bacterium]